MDESVKQEWREYICASPSGARFLSSVGSAVGLGQHTAEATEDIRNFLEQLRRGKRDIRLLASAVDLLNPDYLTFLTHDMPVLLDHLANEVVRKDEVVGPALRGNPRWDRTILGRLSGALSVGRYYSRTGTRSFERPENELLRWLLSELSAELHHLERELGIEALPLALKSLLAKSEVLTRHHWLNEISVPRKLSLAMVLAAKRSRRREYRVAGALAERRHGFQAEVANGRWRSILSLLSSGWLEPVDPDDLFELFALTLCLEVVSCELGFGAAKELGLVLRQRQYVAKFDGPLGTLEVFFDQSPRNTLGVDGRYAEVLKAHAGVSGSSHRPDITLVLTPPSGPRMVLFVEVKRSSSRDYLADSVYKAFGYIHDFGVLFSGSNPKVVLFVPATAKLAEGACIPEVAFASPSDRTGLAHLLGAGLTQATPKTIPSVLIA